MSVIVMMNIKYIDIIWITLGFLGQSAFFMRFLLQWIETEKKKESIIPASFWYFSLAGGILLLLYAVHKKDMVFIVGQSGGIFVYARNIYFNLNKRNRLN